MTNTYAKSKTAQKAFELVKGLQNQLVLELEAIDTQPLASHERFAAIEWARAEGRFGGGVRYVAQNPKLFNRASVNISQVQYEDDPTKKLSSATALSTIVHPTNPMAPSMHMHISWTETKQDTKLKGYWRIMADLNPSHPNDEDTRLFETAFREAVTDEPTRKTGREQGEQYFHIPALGRHRGVAHFYLEEYKSEDAVGDLAFAEVFGKTIIKTYTHIVSKALKSHNYKIAEGEKAAQLAYHTLYFLQVLTLDRGTTSGILVHNENDVGILGSLPSHVDRNLLQSWLPKLPSLQQKLLEEIISVLPEGVTEVTDNVKMQIAALSREFYKRNPEALDLLARGDIVPPTQDNHR